MGLVSTIALVTVGLVLVFAGAALSVYSVGLLGALFGAGGGYILGSTAGTAMGIGAMGGTVLAVLIGASIGVLLTYRLLPIALGVVSIVAGTYLGGVLIAPLFVTGPWYLQWLAAVGLGFATGTVALLLTRTALIVTTAGIGAALASRSVTLADLTAASAGPSLEPLLFDVTTVPFLALVVLGILSQTGLFRLGHVRRIAALLPGADVLTNSRRS
ncbi:MAG: phosphate ABC transporter permease [Salinarchaeum sp.]